MRKNKLLSLQDKNTFGYRLAHLMEAEDISATELSRRLYAKGLLTPSRSKGSYEANMTPQKHQINSTATLIRRHVKVPMAKNIDSQYLYAYCEYFKCSADYLYCYIDYPTHVTADIANATGLSEKAASKLIKLHTAGGLKLSSIDIKVLNAKANIDWLNMVLESGLNKNNESIFSIITSYLNTAEHTVYRYINQDIFTDKDDNIIETKEKNEQIDPSKIFVVGPAGATFPIDIDDYYSVAFKDKLFNKIEELLL